MERRDVESSVLETGKELKLLRSCLLLLEVKVVFQVDCSPFSTSTAVACTKRSIDASSTSRSSRRFDSSILRTSRRTPSRAHSSRFPSSCRLARLSSPLAATSTRSSALSSSDWWMTSVRKTAGTARPPAAGGSFLASSRQGLLEPDHRRQRGHLRPHPEHVPSDHGVDRRLGSDMVELLDQYLLQYVTLLFAQYQSTIRYQSQTVE